jgi:hypothetical protein
MCTHFFRRKTKQNLCPHKKGEKKKEKKSIVLFLKKICCDGAIVKI